MIGGSSSPNSVIGLNVRDLASRYGGKVGGKTAGGGGGRYSRSPGNISKGAPSSSLSSSSSRIQIAKTKIEESNMNGDVECTLAVSMSTSTSAEEAEPEGTELNSVPIAQSYLRRQKQLSTSKSPTNFIGQSPTRQLGGLINDEHGKDSGNKKDIATPLRKKWGWPSPQRYDTHSMEQNHTIKNIKSWDSSPSSYYNHVVHRAEVEQSTNDKQPQYLQMLKQTRKNTAQNNNERHHFITHHHNDSVESNSVTALEEEEKLNIDMIQHSETLSPSPSMIKPLNSFEKTKKMVESNNNSDNNQKHRWGGRERNKIVDSNNLGYQRIVGKTVNADKDDCKNQEYDKGNAATNKVKSKIETSKIAAEKHIKVENTNVLEKANFWKNQSSSNNLTIQRNRARSPGTLNQQIQQRYMTTISKSKSFDSLGNQKQGSIARSSPVSNVQQVQKRYLTSELKAADNDRIITKTRSLESLSSNTKTHFTNSICSNAQSQDKETSVQKSKWQESLVKKQGSRDYSIPKVKNDTSPHISFTRHIQYMQSKSQPQNHNQSKHNTLMKNTLKNNDDYDDGEEKKFGKLVVSKTSAARGYDRKLTPQNHYWNIDDHKERKEEKIHNSSTDKDTGVKLENENSQASIDTPTIQDEPSNLQESKKNNNNDTSTASAIIDRFEKNHQPNLLEIRERRVTLPTSSPSSMNHKRLRQSQAEAANQYNLASHNNSTTNSDVHQKVCISKPNSSTQLNSGYSKSQKDPRQIQVTEHSGNQSASVNRQRVNKGLHDFTDHQFSTPEKDQIQASSTKYGVLIEDHKKKPPTLKPRQTAMETKSPDSVSPSRKSLQARIRKFDTGGEVPMPVPHCKMIPRQGYQKFDSEEQMEESSILEEKNSFKPLLNLSASKENFEDDKNDVTDVMDNLEQSTTIADKSFCLSVNEAKALLWDTNEKLQAWPQHADKGFSAPIPLPLPSHSTSKQMKPPLPALSPSHSTSNQMKSQLPTPSPSPLNQIKTSFKSKLFERAAEAAQTIRKTNSTDSHESYKRKNNKMSDNDGKKWTNIQSFAVSPQTSNPQSGFNNCSNNVLEDVLNPRQQVKRSIQNKSLRKNNSLSLNNDEGHSDIQHTSSVAKLVLKLASIKRDDPTAALEAIDYILQSESRELGIIEEEVSTKSNSQQSNGKKQIPAIDNQYHEQAMSEQDDASSYFSDSDDSTVSAITDPTYQSGVLETSSVISYSTVSRAGKRRQISYHVTKDGALQQQHTSTRSIKHRNKKLNGYLGNHHTSFRHHPKISKAHDALNASFDSDALQSSNTMISPPLVERTTTSENSGIHISNKPPGSPQKQVRGGKSADNQRLLRKINKWDDDSDDDENDNLTNSRSTNNKQPTSPASNERLKKTSSKEHTSPSDKIKRLARVVDEKPERFRRDPSPTRRFLYPPANPKPDQTFAQDIQEAHNNNAPGGATELPANIAAAFDDVSVSFSSHNMYTFNNEECSFLSPLAKKFSKVEERFTNNDPY